MKQFSQAHERILLALAQYKYLTVSQFTELGIMKDKRNVSKKVKELKDNGFIKSIAYGFVPKIGRVENVNFLTPKAKKTIIEGLDSELTIKIPIGRANLFFKDYFHRTSTIDFQIHLTKRAEANEHHVLFFDTYFDKTGNNRKEKNLRAKTKIDIKEGYMIPDAVFMLESAKLTQSLYLVEVYNGKDTARTIKQITKHTQAVELGSVNEQYRFMEAYRILCVFEHQSMMEAVIGKMAEDQYFSYMKDHFYFKTLASIHHSNFMEQRRQFDRQLTKII